MINLYKHLIQSESSSNPMSESNNRGCSTSMDSTITRYCTFEHLLSSALVFFNDSCQINTFWCTRVLQWFMSDIYFFERKMLFLSLTCSCVGSHSERAPTGADACSSNLNVPVPPAPTHSIILPHSRTKTAHIQTQTQTASSDLNRALRANASLSPSSRLIFLTVCLSRLSEAVWPAYVPRQVCNFCPFFLV